MNLISLVFLAFCLITLLIYFVIPKKIQWCVLLISSIVFLFYGNLSLSVIWQFIIIVATSYIFSILIDKYRDTKKSKIFLLVGIFIILGQLAYLKYSNLIITTFNQILKLLGIGHTFELVQRKSLIGISYYSLIMIGYLVDIYRGACKPQENILKTVLFMSYFPILNSGPFIRYNETGEEIFKEHKFNYNAFVSGLIRVVWGIFKILVISTRLGYFVDTVYADLYTYNGFFSIIAALFFTLQLYTNFSGSIDIIMGISEIIGINLPENFTAPFFSRTITEFWRNWHITLGAWLRDYVFYPLQKSNIMQKLTKKCKNKFGKKIGKKIPLYLSMLIMWILIGIWHGGAYTYIIGSGLLQFLFIFLEDILEPISSKINKKLGINTEVFSYKLYQMIRTFLLFSFAMIFFRAPSVSYAFKVIKSIFVWNPWVLVDNSSLYTAGLDMLDFKILNISLIILFVVEYLSRKGSVRKMLFKQNIVFRWVIIYSLIFFIIIFGCYGVGYDPAAFIYRQF